MKTQKTQIARNIRMSDRSENLILRFSDPPAPIQSGPAGGLGLRVFRVFRKTPSLICLFVYLFICLFVLFPTKASAAGLSLGVYPPILQIETTPPAIIKAPFGVQNLGDEPVELTISVKPFSSKSENGKVSYLSKEEIKFNDPLIFEKLKILSGDEPVENISLAPNQQKELTLSIDLPKDEPPSDYYFSIVLVFQGDALEPQENASQVAGGIATNVLLSIGPKAQTIGTIEEFSSPLFLEKGPVPFKVRIKNNNKYFIVPNGNILIKNMFDQTVGNVELLPVNILAGTIRAIPDSLQSPDSTPSASLNSSAFAKASADKQFSILNSPAANWPETFLLGFYKATLTVALSTKGPVLTKTIYFFSFPIKIFVGIIITALVILLIRNKLKKTTNY